MFTSLSDKLQKYLLPIANKIGENRYLQAVKNAFLVSLPFTMFGSLILALANIPYMEKILGADALDGSFIAYPVLICIFLFFRKKKDWKKLGEVALIPGIFSIYEPIVFGFPLMLNPVMLIPMLLTPMVSSAISYIFMYTGLCPLCTGVSVPWTTPMVLSGVITTNSLMGGIVQIVIIAALTVLWYIFLKIMYKQTEKQEEIKE